MNILYTLSGQGFGHATRSKVVIDYLRKRGHFVKIATYGQSFKLMKKWYPDETIEIGGYRHTFLSGRIFTTGMLIKILKDLPFLMVKNFPLFKKIIKNFRINLVINDFEPFSRWFARGTGVPLVTIDNQLLTQLCQIKLPFKYFSEYAAIRSLEFFYPLGDYRFVTSFNPKLTPVKKNFAPHTFVVPSILRKEIFDLKPQKEDFILVYQTAPIYKKKLFKNFFKKPKETFICYNLGLSSRTKNIVLKNFSEGEFLNDLSRAKAVILNGGFTLISEAVYLKKPVLSLPIKGDFEQILNGLLLEKSSYGLFAKKIEERILTRFLKKLPFFEKNLAENDQRRNIIFEKKLERVLHKIEAEI